MPPETIVAQTDPGSSPAPVDVKTDSAPATTPTAPDSVAPASEPAAVPSTSDASAAPVDFKTDSATPAASKVDERVANAQRMMSAATAARAELEKQLRSLGHVPVTQQGQPVTAPPLAQPQAPPQQPPVQATPQPSQPASRQPLAISPEQAKQIHAKYTGASSDEEATAVLVQEVANLLLNQIPTVESILSNRQITDQLYRDFNGRIRTETQSNERAASTIKALDSYFEKHAPGVPLKLIWSFADEAVQAKPGNLTDQALFMLERALGEVGPLLGQAGTVAQTTEAMSRGQGAVLPGGSGLPATGGGEGRPLTFVEQLQRANQGV